MTSRTNLRLVSFDGGGVRGLSQLEIMENIMHHLNWEKQSSGSPPSLPCEYFDLMGGSGTGGLIAIMFAKLRMTVEEASEEFCTIAEEVYQQIDIPPKDRTQRLKQCVENLMNRKKLPVDMKLLDGAQTGGFACFVLTSPRINAGTKLCLRSYPVRNHLASSITVVEAVLATCAMQPNFAPVTFGLKYKKKEYIGAGLGANNPINEVIMEAHSLYGGDATVASLLSVGSGHPGVINISADGTDVDLYKAMWDMMNDCTEKAREIKQRIGRSGIYYRFSVEQGMQNDHPSQAVDMGWIVTQTESYIEQHVQQFEAFAKNPSAPINFVTLSQLKSGNVRAILPAHLDMMDIDDAGPNNETAILSKLKPTDLECSPNVGECMEGTRQVILGALLHWASDFDAPNIFWVKGHPGVGKSAIAISLTESLQTLKRLGSSFFFQRERSNVLTPNALWRVVAYDLARKYPTIRKQLLVTLTANETVPTTFNTEKLFRELIHEPLTTCDEIPTDRLPVIVIDALDECGGLEGQHSEHRAYLRRTLKSWSHLPRTFKLVVTSRGEADFEQLFSTTDHVPLEIQAGTAVQPHSLEDIKVFLEYQCQEIVNRYQRELPTDWPGPPVIQELTFKSGGLFIWAKIIIGFLNRGEPQEQLSRILAGTGAGGMATLYSWILKAAFPHPSEKVINAFRSLVGTIIIAKDPLPASSIMDLCSIDESTMRYIRNELQSVMTSGDVPRFKHQSIVDFLIDPNQCPEIFLVDQKDQNRRLTLQCLEAMKKHLRFNICEIESSYYRNSDIPDLTLTIEEHIPPHISYSCCFWTDHLIETRFEVGLYEMICNFMENRFLFWMEVLSLIRRVNRGSNMMRLLVDWLRSVGRDDKMAIDMKKFISIFGSVISQSVPHIYLSALPFSPQRSFVFKEYGRRYPQAIRIESGRQNDWPAVQNVLIGHTKGVNSVAFSPDGKRIVSGSYDHTIRVWDAETGEGVAGPFKGHTSYVNSVAFSPDGKRVISGSSDRMIRVWDMETGGESIGLLEGHTDDVTSVAFSPDGKRVISGSRDMTIRLWHMETTGDAIGTLEGHIGSVSSVAFSPDGKHIASGSEDMTIRVWDTETREMVAGPFEGHTSYVTSVGFSLDGNHIISGSWDQTIRVWDTKTGEQVTDPFEGHASAVTSVGLSPDGNCIVSGSWDKAVCVWNVETGWLATDAFEGHTDIVSSVGFSPDGKRVISGSYDQTIRVWDAETTEAVGLYEGHTGYITTVAFSLDGKLVVSGSLDMTIRVWDAVTGEVVTGPFKDRIEVINAVAFSPDGKRVVSGSDNEGIRLWDAETGDVVVGPFEGRVDMVTAVQFSPDGSLIASGSRDQTICVWHVETGEKVAGPFEGHTNIISSVEFSPDGKNVISGSYDQTIRVWDVETGEVVVGPLRAHTSHPESIGCLPDGRRIVSGLDDKTIRLWDADTGEAITAPFEGHSNRVNSIALSPDGRRIVSGSFDETIRLWDLTDHTSDLPLFSDCSKLVDGWILGPNSELLFWIPPDLRTGLYWPRTTVIIGTCIKTRLDFKHFVHGQSWSRCKDSLPEQA